MGNQHIDRGTKKSEHKPRTIAPEAQDNDTESISPIFTSPYSMTPTVVMQLQRTHGNAYVQRLINGVQQNNSFQSSLIQRKLTGRKAREFKTFIEGNTSRYKRIKFGDGLDVSMQNFNFKLIKKMLSANQLNVDDQSVKDAAGIIATVTGNVVEVVAPDESVDPLARFDELVDVQSGVSIDNLSDADEWKKFILYGIALEGYHSGSIEMTTVEIDKNSGKRTPKTLQSGLEHRTQKAANRSVWFKWNGKKVEIYALANHIRNDNTKYQSITRANNFLSSWKLENSEAKPL